MNIAGLFALRRKCNLFFVQLFLDFLKLRNFHYWFAKVFVLVYNHGGANDYAAQNKGFIRNYERNFEYEIFWRFLA